jgi:DNA-binding MarR family transcriptional regulator
MSDEALSGDVRDFLAKHIDSIAQLEALFLLKENLNTRWDAHALAKRLYISDQEASDVLSHLEGRGLIVRSEGAFRFASVSDELTRATDLTHEHYRRHLIPITNIVHAKPRRIRQFAAAFKLKKE